MFAYRLMVCCEHLDEYSFRGNNSDIFFLSFFPAGVNSLRIEFAPEGANSFL